LISDFGQILLFLFTGILIIALVLGISSLIRVKNPNEEKLTTYESGEDPQGNANLQFTMRFYVVALVFVLFEIELLFIFPWAVVFGNSELIEQTNGLWGWYAMAEMSVFVILLTVGLAYAWGKGYLDWVMPKAPKITIDSPVPMTLYQEFNRKQGQSRGNQPKADESIRS
jgi:NADH-quinone oxidoreductase subunit A